MNLIDNVLAQIKGMSADDVIQAMGKIYDEPIERSVLPEYPQFMQDIIFIIDLDTELSMEGIGGLLENSTGDYIPNMIIALQNILAHNEANVLQKIYDKYKIDPSDESIDELSDSLYLYTDFDIWPLLETYVDKMMHTE